MNAPQSLDAAIVEHIAEAVVFANRDGVIERWNAAAAAMFGFSAAEATGQRLDLMIPEHLRAAHWRRTPRAETVTVALSPGAAPYKVPHSGGLELAVAVRAVQPGAGVPPGTRVVSVFLVNRRPPAEGAREQT